MEAQMEKIIGWDYHSIRPEGVHFISTWFKCVYERHYERMLLEVAYNLQLILPRRPRFHTPKHLPPGASRSDCLGRRENQVAVSPGGHSPGVPAGAYHSVGTDLILDTI